ncbi:hypothetical protein [Deinococcus hopiensis]|uniref:hypothetical protein n=1 Tax=Deinococcus hopiensis TaxID=309885 RepID=UPI0009FBA725|nr:hypothetical protein [Deinococcus hopiensis]
MTGFNQFMTPARIVGHVLSLSGLMLYFLVPRFATLALILLIVGFGLSVGIDISLAMVGKQTWKSAFLGLIGPLIVLIYILF